LNKRGYLYIILILLLLAGSLTITQETTPNMEGEEPPSDGDDVSLVSEDEGEGENEDAGESEDESENEDEADLFIKPIPDWITPARWYRSNSAGMMLEEIRSRRAAIRNEYALVSDFIEQDELPELLLPYYNHNDHYIEIRVLYRNKVELRRQWLFRDINGLYRLIAVFMEAVEKSPETAPPAENDSAGEDSAVNTDDETIANNADAEPAAEPAVESPNGDAVDGQGGATEGDETDSGATENGATESSETNSGEEPGDTSHEEPTEESAAEHRVSPYRNIRGFIEIYGDNFLLEREIVFSAEDGARETEYTYNKGTLIRSVTLQNKSGDSSETAQKIFTDNYRYHRSGSLRSVERIYHERLEGENAILRFAHRVLDAAANSMFESDQISPQSEFFEEYTVEPEERMVFTTDARNRILTQTLLDSEGEVVWVIKNTWSGDRIASALRIEGDDQKLNEYEYNSKGDLVTERNLHNGVLERQLRIEGNREIEELYMNGVVVLRAVWEDGRKVSEQRVRPGNDSRKTEEQQTEEQQAEEQQAEEQQAEESSGEVPAQGPEEGAQ